MILLHTHDSQASGWNIRSFRFWLECRALTNGRGPSYVTARCQLHHACLSKKVFAVGDADKQSTAHTYTAD